MNPHQQGEIIAQGVGALGCHDAQHSTTLYTVPLSHVPQGSFCHEAIVQVGTCMCNFTGHTACIVQIHCTQRRCHVDHIVDLSWCMPRRSASVCIILHASPAPKPTWGSASASWLLALYRSSARRSSSRTAYMSAAYRLRRLTLMPALRSRLSASVLMRVTRCCGVSVAVSTLASGSNLCGGGKRVAVRRGCSACASPASSPEKKP